MENRSVSSVCFRALGRTELARISVTGARAAYDKHKDTSESKGVKAHFHLDENCLLNLDRVKLRSVRLISQNSSINSRWNSFSNVKKLKPIEILPTMMTIHRLYQVIKPPLSI